MLTREDASRVPRCFVEIMEGSSLFVRIFGTTGTFFRISPTQSWSHTAEVEATYVSRLEGDTGYFSNLLNDGGTGMDHTMAFANLVGR